MRLLQEAGSNLDRRASAEVPAAIVFDLFRTLVAPQSLSRDADARAPRIASSLEVDTKAFESWWKAARHERKRSRLPTIAERVRRYCAEAGTPRSIDRVELGLRAGYQFHDGVLLNPPPEVVSTLRELKEQGIKLAVLSNTDEREIREWPRSPLAAIVPAASFSVDSSRVKPEPEAYAAALGLVGTPAAERSMFVGDGEGGELEGARRFGFGAVVLMRGYLAADGEAAEKNQSDHVLAIDYSIDAIPEILSLTRHDTSPGVKQLS